MSVMLPSTLRLHVRPTTNVDASREPKVAGGRPSAASSRWISRISNEPMAMSEGLATSGSKTEKSVAACVINRHLRRSSQRRLAYQSSAAGSALPVGGDSPMTFRSFEVQRMTVTFRLHGSCQVAEYQSGLPRMTEPAPKRNTDTVVIDPHNKTWQCRLCGESGWLLKMKDGGPTCMACA